MNINLILEENIILIESKKDYTVDVEIYNWNPYEQTEHLTYVEYNYNVIKDVDYQPMNIQRQFLMK